MKFCSDRNIKYESNFFNEFYKLHELIHETTALYFLKTNGKYERMNRTLTDLTIAIMLNSKVVSHYWGKYY